MMRRIVFHIDANSAYLSWQAADMLLRGSKTDLRLIPSVIGGDQKTRHGIVLAKSIPAKKYDIQTGEPLLLARIKCPDLVVIPPNYDLYVQCSNSLVELLYEYSPLIQRYSVDECFLDYTHMEKKFGEPIKAANEIRGRVSKELGFTVNIGIAENKLLAKMASDFKKPDRVHTLFPSEIEEKMWPLPVGDLFMVGRKTAAKLKNICINTIGDLAKFNPDLLKSYLKSHGLLIWHYANGRENSPVIKSGSVPIKGIGNSSTIAFDVTETRTAHMILLSLVETTSMRLRKAGFCAQVVAVSIKNKDFRSYSHQRKIFNSSDCTDIIYQIACQLFDEVWQGEPIRHLGVRLGNLVQNQFHQPSFLDSDNVAELKEIDKTIDQLRSKYGNKSITRASFLHSGLKPLAGGVTDDEYPMMSSLL